MDPQVHGLYVSYRAEGERWIHRSMVYTSVTGLRGRGGSTGTHLAPPVDPSVSPGLSSRGGSTGTHLAPPVDPSVSRAPGSRGGSTGPHVLYASYRAEGERWIHRYPPGSTCGSVSLPRAGWGEVDPQVPTWLHLWIHLSPTGLAGDLWIHLSPSALYTVSIQGRGTCGSTSPPQPCILSVTPEGERWIHLSPSALYTVSIQGRGRGGSKGPWFIRQLQG